jgi:hypothetical protein
MNTVGTKEFIDTLASWSGVDTQPASNTGSNTVHGVVGDLLPA